VVLPLRFEFLVNTAQDDFLGYEHAVSIHPVITKAMTSGVAYTLGEFSCTTDLSFPAHRLTRRPVKRLRYLLRGV
jgi:hypothetical protein